MRLAYSRTQPAIEAKIRVRRPTHEGVSSKGWTCHNPVSNWPCGLVWGGGGRRDAAADGRLDGAGAGVA